MFTEPSTEIIILSAVPIDKDHTHTLYFETASEQEAKFKTFATTYKTETGTTLPVTFYNQQYQRINKNTIKVAIKPDYIYESNYLMFKNSAHSDKWYYAFINNVEYDNENVAIVNYTIDVIQTYMFDYEFGECFIERQHSTTDEIGDNIIPENIDIGVQQISSRTPLLNASIPIKPIDWSYGILVYCTYPLVYYTAEGTRIEFDGTDTKKVVLGNTPNSVFTGCGIYYIPSQFLGIPDATGKTNSTGIIRLSQLSEIGRAESIVAISIINGAWINTDIPISSNNIIYEATQAKINLTDTYNHNLQTTYQTSPKNNKIFTYPFTYMQLTDDYKTKNFRFEFFNMTEQNSYNFKVQTSIAQPNENLLIYPTSAYDGVDDNYSVGLNCSLSTLCTYSTNLYQQWYAQNQNAINSNFATEIGKLLASTAILLGVSSGYLAPIASTAAIGMGAHSAINLVKNEMTRSDKEKLGSELQGATPSNLINLSNYHSNVYAQTVKLRDDYLTRIDNYFTMFGYAQNIIAIPNIHAREGFTYIKTTNCQIHAKRNDNGHYITSFNSDVETEICNIYNNGITFWVYSDEVGDYSVSNDPI